MVFPSIEPGQTLQIIAMRTLNSSSRIPLKRPASGYRFSFPADNDGRSRSADDGEECGGESESEDDGFRGGRISTETDQLEGPACDEVSDSQGDLEQQVDEAGVLSFASAAREVPVCIQDIGNHGSEHGENQGEGDAHAERDCEEDRILPARDDESDKGEGPEESSDLESSSSADGVSREDA